MNMHKNTRLTPSLDLDILNGIMRDPDHVGAPSQSASRSLSKNGTPASGVSAFSDDPCHAAARSRKSCANRLSLGLTSSKRLKV